MWKLRGKRRDVEKEYAPCVREKRMWCIYY
jgi:hypothetical protein